MLSTTTKRRPKKRQNPVRQRSGGGELFREIIVNSRRPLNVTVRRRSVLSPIFLRHPFFSLTESNLDASVQTR